MRIRSDESSQEGVINISSLLDVMFILIIFFLATATFEKLEKDLKVKLPATSAKPSISAKPNTVIVNVRKDGTYTVASRVLNFNQLGDLIRKAVKKNAKQTFTVRGDHRAYYGAVAQVVGAFKANGVKDGFFSMDDKPLQ